MPETGKDDKLLSRKEAAKYLRDRGLQVSHGHLANLAANHNARGGPPYFKQGNSPAGRALYNLVELELWRRGQLLRVE